MKGKVNKNKGRALEADRRTSWRSGGSKASSAHIVYTEEWGALLGGGSGSLTGLGGGWQGGFWLVGPTPPGDVVDKMGRAERSKSCRRVASYSSVTRLNNALVQILPEVISSDRTDGVGKVLKC
eukprot:159858-Prorocentrum_minimum.AAC.3